MSSRGLRWLGIGLMFFIGMIHLYMASAEYDEAAILGYLFVANFVGALVATVGIRRQERWGWVVGFWVAGGAIVGYILTRTMGVPGMEPEEWLYPVGVLSTALELAFVALFLVARPWVAGSQNASRRALVVPIAAFGFVVTFGLAGVVWSTFTPDHAMPDIAHAELISDAAFAEQFGVQVVQLAPSMMDNIVDVRLRIVDKTKAEALLSDHDRMPMLVVDGGKVVLTAPNQHVDQRRIKNGGVYYSLYPNPNHVVERGTQVSVQFGDLRLPAITAQ